MELRDRLRSVIATASPPPAPRLSGSPVGGPDRVLGLRRLDSALGDVYFTEALYPLDFQHGAFELAAALAVDGLARTRLHPGLTPAHLRDAVYFDIETTGLSGGTGTWVFLVAIGRFDSDVFRLRQYFLADPRGEPAMLASVGRELEGADAFVSFNGRRFDLPLIETRLRLLRFNLSTLGRPHLDLLFPAQRLYRKRLPSCSLGSLEHALLGVRRGEDVSGWMIPGLYFDYLRRGQAAPLRAVFRHNLLDVLSLVTLTAHLGARAGEHVTGDAEHLLALGIWDEAEGRTEQATRLYEAALSAGGGGEAARRLARLYRRYGRWEAAERLWLDEAARAPAPRRLAAHVELAKIAEHRARDPARAREHARRALALTDVMVLRGHPVEEVRGALFHRLARLEHRLTTARSRASQRGVKPVGVTAANNS